MSVTTLRWLCLATALAYLPHAVFLPLWVSVVLAVALLARLLLQKPLSAWVLAPLVLAGLTAILVEFRTINGYEPGVSLFTTMIGLKVLETRSSRDGGLLVCLAYFQATAILLISQEIHTTAWVLAVVVVTTMALISLASPAEFPLRKQARLAGVLTLQALPVMLVLFLLFPRLPGPLWGLGEGGGDDGETAQSGLSETMEPGNITELALSREVAFRVRFADETPAPARQYWRGLVLWDFDGREWRTETRAGAELGAQAEFTGSTVDYTLNLQPHGRNWLFALDLPTATPSGTRGSKSFELRTRDRVDSSQQFQLSSALNYVLEPELNEQRRDRALALPADGAARTRELAATLTTDHESPADIVDAALSWLREADFSYTLTPAALGDEPVDEFLFETREGFCEAYASAFTVLMRAADIPARVVIGYQGGEPGLGDYLIVRQAHAHAWVEVWLPEEGWVRVDPTAAAAPERIANGPATEAGAEGPGGGLLGGGLGLRYYVEMAWDSMHFNWDQFVLGYGPELQERLLAAIGLEGMRRYTMGGLAIFVVAIVILAVWLPWQRPQRPRDPVLAAWLRVENKLARAGLPRRAGEGVRDFSRRVATLRPELQPALETISECYLRLRYQPDPDPADLDALRRKAARLRVPQASATRPKPVGTASNR